MVEATRQKEAGISTNELITSVYERLLKEFQNDELNFLDKPPYSVVADDSDHHRRKFGLMYYDRISILTIEDKKWIVALGNRTEGYPADDIAFDFKIFQYEPDSGTDKTTEDYVRSKIKDFHFFAKSTLIGIAGRGMVANDHYSLAKNIQEKLKPQFKEFVAQMPKLNNNFVNLEGFGPPALEQVIRYKPEFAEVMTDTIVEILKEQSS